MIAEWRAFRGDKEVVVHGNASSMMSVFLVFSPKEKNTAIPQSKFVIHRADAFIFDNSVRNMLVSINADIRKAFEERLDIPKLEQIGGVTMDRFFNVDEDQIDINLTAEQAKEVGLINNVLNLNANEIEALNVKLVEAKCEAIPAPTPVPQKEPKKPIKTDTTMTKAEIKEKHPEAYAEILQEGITSAQENATSAEKERVEAWAAWKEVDAEAVLDGIQSGKAITPAKTQEFIVAMTKGEKLKKVQANTPPAAQTTPPAEPPKGKTDEEIAAEEKIDNFEATVRSNLGLKTEKKKD